MSAARRVHAVLFDLDGTLVDTAPDMIGSLNALRAQESLAPLLYPLARTQVSHGSTGMIKLAFPDADPERFEILRDRFLDLYAARLAQDSSLFDGCATVLDALEEHGIHWGIVTNKPEWLTGPLLVALQLDKRPGCVVSGDTLPQRKPHPEPLLHAARALNVAPEDCLYVGDAQRDILAARAASMPVLVASYGYLGPDDDIVSWAADGDLATPLDLLPWLGIAHQ
ncbi:MAG: phosphoglycolate phosphatase [Steroidobacteraceae bacterium]